jgi:Uma2 family endonuclease
MSPSYDHERIKSVIGALVEVYCLRREVPFTTLGSWTLKKKKSKRGAEPDECYVFNETGKGKPHLAIEVEWTYGRIDKLDVYRKLGVREVWYWRKGALHAYALRGEQYRPIRSSEVLPGIDLRQLASFLDRPTTYDAIKAYRAALKRAARA